MDIKYQREKFNAALKEGVQLVIDHGQELRGMKADLDMNRFNVLESEGRLVIITARDIKDRIVGYAVHIWHRHLHFNIRVAQDDAWYVIPELRKQGIGRKLREMSIEELKKDNVKFIYGRLKVAHPHDESMTELGYTPYETVWLKEL